jgi:hypothetical protein
MVRIRFWWPGYSPEDALTTFDSAALDRSFEVSRDHGRSWRLSRPGTTLRSVHEWMVDSDLDVVRTALVDDRRQDGWEGQYVLTIGPNGRKRE